MKTDFLYSLLPIIYRARDQSEGEPLRALMSTLQEQLDIIEEDIATLYDNWFIQSCERWVIPYIADLVAVGGGGAERNALSGERAYVANAIAYRRRKGMAPALGGVIEDVTGWGARVVEFFQSTSTNQTLRSPDNSHSSFVNLRDQLALDQIDGSFNRLAHSADVRSIRADDPPRVPSAELQPGKYLVGNIGVFLWRITSYPIIHGNPREIAPGCYTFSPFGFDAPLFNNPRTETHLDLSSTEMNLPIPLNRRALKAELDARANNQSPATGYFEAPPAIEIAVSRDVERNPGAEIETLPCEQIAIADLTTWDFPRNEDARDARVAVDPALGRLRFPDNCRPAEVRVSYCYGFSAGVGGGPYWSSSAPDRAETLTWSAKVFREATAESGYSTLESALAAWAEALADSEARGEMEMSGVIQIADSGTYSMKYSLEEKACAIALGRSRLIIEALDGETPCVKGDFVLSGESYGAELVLGGLWINGSLMVRGQIQLVLRDCSLWPDLAEERRAAIVSEDSGALVGLAVVNSIVGRIRLAATGCRIEARDSIIDGAGGPAVAGLAKEETGGEPAYGPATTLERVTILGTTSVEELISASHVIFDERLKVRRCGSGYVRFSYVPPGSRTPPRFRCLPVMFGVADSPDKGEETARPRFTSRRFGAPGYAQLALDCPPAIKSVGENGAEIGAFSHLHQTDRVRRLHAIIKEYLPYGLNAGIFYVS